MMCQDEHRRVVRRFLSPPSFPVLVRPRPANRSEHVPPENPCADSDESLLGDLVVNAGFAARMTVHFLPDLRVEKPVHQLGASHTERILKVLVRTSAITIN